MYGVFLHGSPFMCVVSLQNRRDFGRRMVSILLVKVIAAISEFFSSGGLWREGNIYQGGG